MAGQGIQRRGVHRRQYRHAGPGKLQGRYPAATWAQDRQGPGRRRQPRTGPGGGRREYRGDPQGDRPVRHGLRYRRTGRRNRHRGRAGGGPDQQGVGRTDRGGGHQALHLRRADPDEERLKGLGDAEEACRHHHHRPQ